MIVVQYRHINFSAISWREQVNFQWDELCTRPTRLVGFYFRYSSLKQQSTDRHQGWIQDFKLGGAHLKNLRRAEGGAKICGVFRVKNQDFTPKNHIFYNLCGARAGCAPPLDPPLYMSPQTDTSFWFWANRYLFFLLNATGLVEKQHIPIL